MNTLSVLSPPSSATIFLASTALALLVWSLFTRTQRTHNAVPPGPRPLPLFLGNLHQLPSTNQHITFTAWAAKYGHVVYARFAHQQMVILSSARDAVELMEKRGARYSNRPRFTYFNELVEWTAGTPWMPYNDKWKLHRKWMQHSIMSRAALDGAEPVQRRESLRLLSDLVQSPSQFRFHLKRYVVAVIFEIGYGRAISTLDDDFIRLVEQGVNESLTGGSSSGGALVDLFPILRFVPAWLPGPGAQSRWAAERSRKTMRAVENIPYDQVRREMAEGTARPSMVKATVESYIEGDAGALTEEIEYQIKGAAGTLYIGATETTLATLCVCIFQFMMHPDVLEKAQAEIDRVVGSARLPDFDDRPSLPYLECVIREVFRIFPPIPLGVPHLASEDDVFHGYHIPKGCGIVSNIWAMLRDPELYPDPEVFRPERFLGFSFEGDAEWLDPTNLVFGFGRRACPGRALGERNVWLVLARLVATMDVGKEVGQDGQEITPVLTYRSGIVNYPDEFPCRLSPRSEKARQLVLECNADL